MAVGTVGNYVARIFEESKRRPLYVVSDAVNAKWRGEPPERGVVLQPRLQVEALASTTASVRKIPKRSEAGLACGLPSKLDMITLLPKR